MTLYQKSLVLDVPRPGNMCGTFSFNCCKSSHFIVMYSQTFWIYCTIANPCQKLSADSELFHSIFCTCNCNIVFWKFSSFHYFNELHNIINVGVPQFTIILRNWREKNNLTKFSSYFILWWIYLSLKERSTILLNFL